MGSSIQACYDMIEQEQYDKEIKKCENFLKNTTPEQLRLIMLNLNEGYSIVDKYGMGGRPFWAGVNKIRDILDKMPKI